MFQNNLLMGAAAASSGGASVVSVGNSALFTSNSQELERTPSGAGNVDKWTFSTWVYFCDTTNSTSIPIFGAINTSANQNAIIISNTGQIYFQIYLSSAHAGRLITTQLLRDIGWYHIVVVYDSGNAVASNREIIYLNGERVTEFATEAYVSQNLDGLICGTHLHQVGMFDGLATSLNGYLAETVLLDGTATGPTSFGVYDSSGLFWTPLASETIKELSFGTTGFYLDNTTNAQTDASGEGNNFTNTGSVTTNTHTPTNMSALLNPLMSGSTGTFSSGNRTATLPPVNTSVISNMAIPSTGKWYCEFRFATIHGYSVIGVGQMDASSWLVNGASYISPSSGAIFTEEGTLFTQGTTSGDVITVTTNTTYGAMWDADNSILKITDGTDTYQCAYTVNDTSVPLGFQFAISSGSVTGNVSVNFGDPPFAISSGNADDNGQGNFEFAPPTGYLALNTSNLASTTTRTASDTTKYFDTILYEGNGQGQRVGQFQPFGDSFTVAKSGLWSASSADLTRGSMSGTGTTWTFSAWVKRAEPAVGSATANFVFTTASNAGLAFGGAGTADEVAWYSGSYTGATNSDLVNDQSQWYHVVVKNNGGTGTIYLNGNEVLGSLTVNTADATMAIGSYNGSSNEFDGYISEVVFVESALAPTSFAKTDTSTNRWVPIDVSGLTYSGNSFYLNFADSSDLGNDVSGNNKDFTNNSGVLSSTDSPTTNANVWNSAESNFAGGTYSNGNRTVVTGSSQISPVQAGLPISSGKWYCEVVPQSSEASFLIGLTRGLTTATNQYLGQLADDVAYYGNGNLYMNGASAASYGASYAQNDVIGMAIDLDNNTLTYYKNGASQGVIGLPSPSSVSHPYYVACGHYWSAGTGTYLLRSLSSDWTGTAPTNHIAITQDNMTSSDQFISAFSWIKNRDAADNHMLFDRVRGVHKDMHSNDTAAEVTNVNTLQQFLAGGVQVGNDVEVNTANESYVLWNFMMEATGSGSALESGSINTTALVDTTLGMSVGTYTGTGSANETIETGLTGCEMIIVKRTNATYGWAVWHSGLTDDYSLLLNTNAAQVSSGYWDTSGNTSTLIELGTDSEAVNKSGQPYNFIAFAPSQFISIGSYEGNGNANGTFIPTLNSLDVPIQPVWTLIKEVDGTNSWGIRDIVRNPYNVVNKELHPNLNNAEYSSNTIDIVTGGIKNRVSGVPNTASTYIYLAIGTPIIDTDGRIIAGR